MYWCANAVTRAEGLASAVLLRAVEPLEGIEAMHRRRKPARRDIDLTNGPSKLCDAFGITGGAHHGTSFLRGPLRILEGEAVPDHDVAVTPRIGLNPKKDAYDWPLRWIVRSSPYVSAPTATRRYLASGK